MKNQSSFVLQGELLLTFLWEWCSASWNGNVPDQGKGELALRSCLWVIRLPKHASICQIEFKAHSSHGNSEFPFLLSSKEARTQERGDAAKGWVQKSLFVLRTPFFLKRQTMLNVSWRLFLHFTVSPGFCLGCFCGFFSTLPLFVLRHVVKQSYPSLLFWEEYPTLGKFQPMTTKRRESIGIKTERLNPLSSTGVFPWVQDKQTWGFSPKKRMFCVYLHICTSVPIRLKLLIAPLLVKTLHTKHPSELENILGITFRGL